MLKLNFEKSIFIPTGWPGLDAELNGGLLSKTVTAVLAKPGMGTSAFAMNICLNAPRKAIGVFSLHMMASICALRRCLRQNLSPPFIQPCDCILMPMS